VVRAIAASSLIASSATATIDYAKSLPPMPDQTQIACRDGLWEKQNLTEVEGARAHTKLAPFVSAALSDARRQYVGLNISIAYRTCDHQLALRKMNCGLGDFNIYQKPSDLCTPPTEPAGKSLHNEGLALDFYCYGYSLFENSPCYTWLKTNGKTYHLYNHALEAWHWSTTGK
jgi:D-alanyl-D-alanine carboxypeptidase-like protein